MKTIFKVLILLLISSTFSRAELLNPNSTISPKEVIKIQLNGLQQNDLEYKDSGIEQTWKFAHPNNKRVTGPLSNCLLYTSPSPRDVEESRMPSSA